MASPHKIEQPINETPAEVLSRDLAAIKDFLFYVESEPFINHDKAEKRKRVAFKKTSDNSVGKTKKAGYSPL